MVSSGPWALSARSCTPWSYTDRPGFCWPESPQCVDSLIQTSFFLFKTNDGDQHIDGSARAT